MPVVYALCADATDVAPSVSANIKAIVLGAIWLSVLLVGSEAVPSLNGAVRRIREGIGAPSRNKVCLEGDDVGSLIRLFWGRSSRRPSLALIPGSRLLHDRRAGSIVVALFELLRLRSGRLLHNGRGGSIVVTLLRPIWLLSHSWRRNYQRQDRG